MMALSRQLATCFGIGRIPLAPGTFASAAAIPLGWLLAFAGWEMLTAAAIVVITLGIWACDLHARALDMTDPPECVLDEVAGQWLALIPIAAEARVSDWRAVVTAFLLFRLFDIWKPWPVSALQKLPGGLGIMLDDVLAGLIAAAALFAVMAIRLV